eukprot:TRINITY_DN1330_c0_g1_i2.p1 TRINITY_DN1330_c0_g1~~TRINITY_DN1330_c0_g1_i2.p1  ORF type:complete len:212 (+),score=46.00 TRINITY_DN1330_c0_g1_i2:52-636(+)
MIGFSLRKIITVAVIMSLLTTAESKKKKKKERKVKQGDIKDRPYQCPDNYYCEGCKAIVKVLSKAEERSKKEKKGKQQAYMMEALMDVCEVKNFQDFSYPPPQIRIGCMSYVQDHDDLLEDIFVNGKAAGRDDLQKFLCYEITDACLQVEQAENKKGRLGKETYERESIKVSDAENLSPERLAKIQKGDYNFEL